ncbi:MAG: hypothetical protein AMJ65_18900, partial [Phycisphaerae bacterium SG8_4]
METSKLLVSAIGFGRRRHALLSLLLLLIAVGTGRDSGVDAVLSRAGFPRLPESARDVRVDRQGTLLSKRVVLVKFEA